MTRSRPFLIVSSVLLTAWIGYLGYLAVTHHHPVVLSRPQFLASELDVVAKVTEETNADGLAEVESVSHYRTESQKELKDKQIVVKGLTHSEGWKGPGRYILPLVPIDSSDKDTQDYFVAGIPRSPGAPSLPARIYPVTAETIEQLESISKAKK
jgi:hypothetical protein